MSSMCFCWASLTPTFVTNVTGNSLAEEHLLCALRSRQCSELGSSRALPAVRRAGLVETSSERGSVGAQPVSLVAPPPIFPGGLEEEAKQIFSIEDI